MNRRYWIGLIGLLVLAAIYFFWQRGSTEEANLYAKVKKGDFEIVINTSGELFAKNSVDIRGPDGLRAAQIWNVKIASIIPEGTNVKKGDVIASLDRSELSGKIKDKQAELDKAVSKFTQTKLDTTLELRELRDKLVNMRYDMQQKRIELDQSQYEPPATIQKAKIELEKAERAYNQAVKNYELQKNKAIAKMQEAAAELEQVQRSVDFMQELIEQFTITAPEDGMMIYQRDWNGQKKREGSSISAWNPVVATLPDMSVMVSRTYVSEVDIRKVKVGQSVKIGLDAFPEKTYRGKVVEVANVGEQRPNSDAKVFLVDIEVKERDSTLLPSMTTSNLIVAETLKDVLYVPLESIHNQGDSLSYVFLKSGNAWVKQEVALGKANDNEAEILKGLKEDQTLMLSKPEDADKLTLQLLPKADRLRPEEEKDKQKLSKQ